ncbi:hypothetical protein CCACVL1_21611, partial [Corchorus capsularis]
LIFVAELAGLKFICANQSSPHWFTVSLFDEFVDMEMVIRLIMQ